MLSLRLSLTECWTGDGTRLAKAYVPEAFQAYRTKPEIAIVEIDRAIAADLRFGCVLTDADDGISALFRQVLRTCGTCLMRHLARLRSCLKMRNGGT